MLTKPANESSASPRVSPPPFATVARSAPAQNARPAPRRTPTRAAGSASTRLTPKITAVAASVDASCHLVVGPGIAAPLVDGDGVFVYIDSDGNPATGAAALGGADVAIVTVGLPTSVSPPLRGVWNGETFVFD